MDYSLSVDPGEMHDARSSASAVLDEIARGEDDAARTAEHHRRLRMLHRRLHDDARLLREISLPSPAILTRSLSRFCFVCMGGKGFSLYGQLNTS